MDPDDHNKSDHDALCAEEAVLGDDPVCADECLEAQSGCADPDEPEHAPSDCAHGEECALVLLGDEELADLDIVITDADILDSVVASPAAALPANSSSSSS